MRISVLDTDPGSYSSKVYLIRGDYNSLDDLNTLIDTGANSFIISGIETINTGVGKKSIEQVILTHNHFDHTGGLKHLLDKYHPKVLAGSFFDGVTRQLQDGDIIKAGDKYFTVLLTPGHSNDSICLYCPEGGVLFSGDTLLDIRSGGGSYTLKYLQPLERLAELDIQIIYPGHGDPITSSIKEMFKRSLFYTRSSLEE